MAITFKKPLTGSDLILKEMQPFNGYTRGREATVTVTAGEKLTLGAPVYRAKGVAGAKWKPVVDNTALVDTNEIAFYFADVRGIVGGEIDATGDHNVALIQMGNIILKDATILAALKANFAAVVDADFAKVKEMALSKQIVIEKVLGA